jgi:hypothetical protein
MRPELRNKIINYGIVGLALFLSIFRSTSIFGRFGYYCPGLPYKNLSACVPINIGQEISLWLITILLIGYQLIKSKNFGKYISVWKNKWYLVFFLLLALFSAFWSSAFQVTLTKGIVLIFCTLTFGYISWYYKLDKVIQILVYFFAILIIVNFYYVLLRPNLGIMSISPWVGSWTGVLCHKNYLGSIFAFGSTVFFIDFLIHPNYHPLTKVLLAISFLLSLVLIIYSKSAAGILILFLLLGTSLVFYIWSKLRTHLRSPHYIILGIIALIAIAAILLNLDFFFGLVNRNTSLTGRVPLWQYLYNQVILVHPYLGYGYGAIWSFPEFREITRKAVGWGYPIFIGDNGLIDIFLHLGITGVVSILIVILMSIKHAIMMIVKRSGFIYTFPMIALIYMILANISLSMLLESEYLVWFLILIPLFTDKSQIFKHPDRINSQISSK